MSVDRQTLAQAIADNLKDGLDVEIEEVDLELPEEDVSEEVLGAAIARRLLDELT